MRKHYVFCDYLIMFWLSRFGFARGQNGPLSDCRCHHHAWCIDTFRCSDMHDFILATIRFLRSRVYIFQSGCCVLFSFVVLSLVCWPVQLTNVWYTEFARYSLGCIKAGDTGRMCHVRHRFVQCAIVPLHYVLP